MTDVEKHGYHCKACGKLLFLTTVPFGTDGEIELPCADRMCHEYNTVQVTAIEQVSQSDTDRWSVRRRQMDKARKDRRQQTN